MTVTTDDGLTPDTRAQLLETIDLLEESLADVQLGYEDAAWIRLGDGVNTMSRQEMRTASRTARVMALADPLIRRGVNLRTAYVWGQGVQIQAAQEEDGGQDVNGVVQAFLDDQSNLGSFSSSQAREELERRFATDGNNFYALATTPNTGRVQVRVIPSDEIIDIITNPEDAAEPWLYKRTYTRRVFEAAGDGLRTRDAEQTVYYPALGYSPKSRPKSINGDTVAWDMPVLHSYVNRPDGSLWGVGDTYAALPFARGYVEFLQDWARLVKALSRIAFRATTKRAGAAQVRDKLETPPVYGQVAGTVVTGENQTFEAVNKSGATIDSGSGRPLAAMVASALDVPVTMLLADPGVTGARATAETLDKPLENVVKMRQSVHTTLIMRVLNYVIDQAIRAPQGRLKGTLVADPYTASEIWVLTGDQARGLDVDWPSLDAEGVGVRVDAIVKADGTQLLPPLEVARMLLVALGSQDVDEILATLVDADGNFVYPADSAAAQAQQDAVAAGNLPGTTGPPDQPAE